MKKALLGSLVVAVSLSYGFPFFNSNQKQNNTNSNTNTNSFTIPFWGSFNSDNTSEIKTDEESKKFYTKGLIQPIEITDNAISQLHITKEAFKNNIASYSSCKKFSINFGPGMFKKIISNNCFNVTDVASMPSMFKFIITPTISTKIAGEPFFLRMDRVWALGKQCWRAYDVNFTLVDLDDNNKTISSTQTTFPLMQFNIDKAYKNVAVKIQYKKLSTHAIPVSCSTCGTNGIQCIKLKEMKWEKTGGLSIMTNFMNNMQNFMKNGQWSNFWNNFNNYSLKPKGEKCYSINNYEVVTEYALDNFAIRPDKFQLSFDDNTVKVKENVKMDIKALNYNSNTPTPNYNESSINLSLSTDKEAKAMYSFYIKDGALKTYKLYFTKPSNNVNVTLKEKSGSEWAKVDTDDTKDSCRLINNASDTINVIDASKYWAGTGTNESKNDPTKNSVNSDIRQNVDKDLHFNKMSW